jgi:uncharacterized protein YjbI with pentapeptide repeats
MSVINQAHQRPVQRCKFSNTNSSGARLSDVSPAGSTLENANLTGITNQTEHRCPTRTLRGRNLRWPACPKKSLKLANDLSPLVEIS